EARLSVLAESGGGNGWVGVEESGSSLGKRSSSEGLLRLPVETRLALRKKWQLVFYDDALQPVHTVELGRINENQLVLLDYETTEVQGETGELVVTDKQRNVLRDAEVTLRSSLFTTTAKADRTLLLPVGEYEVQVENSKGIGTAWQKITVSNDAKKVEELEPTWYRDSLKDGGFGPAMISLPGGSFRMGDIQGQGENDEKPVHEVSVDAFALGRYEVTVGEFRAFIEQNGYQLKDNSGCFVDQNKTADWQIVEGSGWDKPFFVQSDDQPVVCVSWEDAAAYAQWLSEQTGQQYRLPTEAEWEYAARAGTETARYWGDDLENACGSANVADTALALYYPSKKKDWTFHECPDGWVYTAPVGSLNTNSFFLHDMLGNVLEWTADWYDEKYYAASPAKGPANNPQGPKLGAVRVIRGGSWGDTPVFVRSAGRDGYDPAYRFVGVGFRLARDTLDSPTSITPDIPISFRLAQTGDKIVPISYEQSARQALERIIREQIEKISDIANSIDSSDENNIKGYVLSTQISTFSDIPENIDNEIKKIKEQVQLLIRTVAVDIEVNRGKSGILSIDENGKVQYEPNLSLPEELNKKRESFLKAKLKNNVSIRSTAMAIQLFLLWHSQRLW
ncbi:MAG: formylglycine-generating enzyme family protein, partial [Candidatus Electrothrix sp. AR1]|nr:formylglycine-generating enzyme family protein [Candidatus Electrothrix sp. AR1]